MENFKTYYDKGTRKRIGFFPGGFKPPHAGHFAALQSMLGYDVKNPETGRSILLDGAETSDYVYVIVGHTPRGSQDQNDTLRKMKARKNTSQQELDTAQEAMITKDMSIKIWELFITQGDSSLKGKVDVSISPHASPLIGMEQKILSLDGKDIENSIINLYAGAEDQARYQYFISDKFKLKVAEEKNIDVDDIQIKNNKLDRLGSATDARSQIIRVAASEADMDTLQQFTPPGVDKLKFMDILQPFHKL